MFNVNSNNSKHFTVFYASFYRNLTILTQIDKYLYVYLFMTENKQSIYLNF